MMVISNFLAPRKRFPIIIAQRITKSHEYDSTVELRFI